MTLAWPLVGAENEAPHDTPFQIKYWTTEDGLPQQQISSLEQTRDGYLWIGTYSGLSRFDGFGFTRFDESTTPEIMNESVDALAEDSEGTLWIGTAGGLLSYRDHHFDRVRITCQENQSVRRIIPARGGGLWLSTLDFGVARLRDGHFLSAWQPVKRGEDDIVSFAEGTNGWLNIFTKSKWLIISPDATEIRTNSVRQSEAPAWTAALPGKMPGQAWIGTKEGIFGMGGQQLAPIPEDLSGSNRLNLIFQDRVGNLWANVQNEFFGVWDGADWRKIDFGDEVDKGTAICMEQDFEGSIWIATKEGLVQLHAPLALAYTKTNGIAHNKVWSVCEGIDGAIWAGTEQGLSRIEKDGKIHTVAAAEFPGGPSDRCLWPNGNGGVWTARNNHGLFFWDNRQLLQAADFSSLSNSPITCLGEGRSNTLYVCTEKGVLAFREDAPIPWTQSLAHWEIPGVRSMFETRDGTVWLGTSGNGVARIQGRTVSYPAQTNALGRSVWSICEDNKGTLWFGTDKGLTRYQRGELFPFTTRHGLLENRVNCVLTDDDGYLWFSGLQGIYRVQIAGLNDVADGRARTVEPFALGTADGLKRAETNGEKQPAGWKARDGRLWFPTVRGVVVIDPKRIPRHETPPPVVIEQVKADNKAIRLGSAAVQSQTQSTSSLSPNPDARSSATNYQIPAGQGHVVEFQYTANSLVDSRRVKFRYRLSPADPDWREETSERSVRYYNLRPGNYFFEVKASNHHNVWNHEPERFAFSLAPYFWQTKAFYGASGAAVLAIAAGVQAYRLRWQHRLLKLEQQRALAAERARIARDLHDDLGTALTGLALELDVIGRDPGPEVPATNRLGQTAQRTRALAERMREVVWSVNPRCDTVPSIASFLEQQISQFLRADGIKVELDFPDDIPALPIGGEARHQLALGVREALTNVVRHAHATEVVLSLAIDENWLIVQVKDNGRGLQPASQNGDGLRNMRDRLQSIGGAFDFTTKPGLGTTIIFRVPLIKTKSGESI